MTSARLSRIEVTNYRAFAEPAALELAPLTFIVGRNNMGKTSLLRAPRFLSHVLDPRAEVPFDLGLDGLEWGGDLNDLCYAGNYSFEALLTVTEGEGETARHTTVGLTAAALPDRGHVQFLERLAIGRGECPPQTFGRALEWARSRAVLADETPWGGVHGRIALLTAGRAVVQRSGTTDGTARHRIGARGEHLPGLMLSANRRGLGGLDRLNTWLGRLADKARADVRLTDDGRISIGVQRPGEPRVPVVDCGSGVGQILPVIAALTLVPEDERPHLLSIEQPESELHPAVHADVAELLIEAAMAPGGPRLLVETHSDPLLLRIRAALAEQRLAPEHVRLYVVEPDPDAVGSRVRLIEFDDRGTPHWWPSGLFAEPAREFRRIIDALTRRDARP